MMQVLYKNFYHFKEPITFNILPALFINYKLQSFLQGCPRENEICYGVFHIRGVDKYPPFHEVRNKMITELNIQGKTDLDIFCSFAPGVSGDIHRDTYEVVLLSVLGETCYRVDDKKYFLKPGDLLRVGRGHPHQAIGLDPRIVLSLGHGF